MRRTFLGTQSDDNHGLGLADSREGGVALGLMRFLRLRVLSSISKNRKESTHYLRAELIEILLGFRPADESRPLGCFVISYFGCLPLSMRSGDPIVTVLRGLPRIVREKERICLNAGALSFVVWDGCTGLAISLRASLPVMQRYAFFLSALLWGATDCSARRLFFAIRSERRRAADILAS